MEIVAFVVIAIVVIVVVILLPRRKKSQQPHDNQPHLQHEHRTGRARALRDRLRSKTPRD
jgi:hypothetical protein